MSRIVTTGWGVGSFEEEVGVVVLGIDKRSNPVDNIGPDRDGLLREGGGSAFLLAIHQKCAILAAVSSHV